MTICRRVFGSVVLALMLTTGGGAAAQPPPQQQGEFVPLSEAGPQEQLPAAPLLITAYAFVWVAVLAYAWTIAQRIRKVEMDLEALERRLR